MNYKALIFDIDGTAVANSADGFPSPRLIQAVEQAKKKIYITAASGRSPRLAKPITDSLNIELPCILFGGTQLYDFKTNKILWEKKIEIDAMKQIMEICKPYPYLLAIGDSEDLIHPRDINAIQEEHVLYLIDLDQIIAEKIALQLKNIGTIAAHLVHSWNKGVFDIHITHAEATKKHAVDVLLKNLDVSPSDAIGVGDSGNDIPLLEHVGFKVAMGNAAEDLKAIANYIAPSVDDDGLAHVIETFVLK